MTAIPEADEPAPVRPVPLCTHIKANGVVCGSPAAKGTDLCFHHSTVKTALGRVTPLDQVPYGIFSPIPFVFAEDAASLQINFHLLLQAVAEKRVDPRTGTLLHRILRSMATNLKNPLIAESPATHGEGDKINPQPGDTAPAASHATKFEEEKTSPQSDRPAPSLAPKTKARPEDDPALAAAIEALPPSTREAVSETLASSGYLSQIELEYYSLPPYDKEAKSEPRQPNPLHPEVQRVLTLYSERP